MIRIFGFVAAQEDEQILVKSLTTTRVFNGPCLKWVAPLNSSTTRKAIPLGELEYLIVTNTLTGEKRVEQGPKQVFLGSHDADEGVKTAISLNARQFVRFLDNRTGKVRVVLGEAGCVVPGAYEKIKDDEGVLRAIDLKNHEYIRVQNKRDGTQKIARGEQLFFLGAYDEQIGGIQEAISIDSETAVLVRNKRSGQQRLVTEQQIFVPHVDEEVLKVQKLIKLADYEGCIVRGQEGEDKYYYGSIPEQRSFFIPPYSEMVELVWSRGRRRETRDLRLKKLDLRPFYMSFEFNTHTKDNVELILEGSFFWEIVDLPSMVRMTGDTTGDVCNHARSKFIEAVSKVTLQEFMQVFNKIAADVHKLDDSFYADRGVKIHSLEVTSYRCADDSTARILQQIIQETTNRMNKLQQQESANEVGLQQMKGEIEQEHAKGDLLAARIANSEKTAKMEGIAEGERLTSFLATTAAQIPDVQSRLELWKVLRKRDALEAVSGANSHFYYTPADANLTIEARQ